MRNKSILCLLIIILIMFLTIILYNKFLYVTPEKAFNNFQIKNNYIDVKVLSEVQINKNEKVYFRKDYNNQLAAVIVKETFPNHWKVIGQVGFVDMNKIANNTNFMWGKLIYTKDTTSGMYLGFINNEQINNIFINNTKVNILKIGDSYIWYLFSTFKGADIKIEK